MRSSLILTCLVSALAARIAFSHELPRVSEVEAQPLKAQVGRVVQALELLGQPLTAAQRAEFEAAVQDENDGLSVAGIQEALDPLVLVGVTINPESRVKVAEGPAAKRLIEQGWSVFLVKVHNQAGVTARLRVASPNAAPVYLVSTGAKQAEPAIDEGDVLDRWLEIQAYDKQPLVDHLSGLALEYRVLQLFSRDRGRREATLAFDVGQGTQDLGFRNEIPILFDCAPAIPVTLRVQDHDGTPAMAQFVFRDDQRRVYPALAKRLAPDFFFHDQVYRQNGEHVLLPPGEYDVTCTRGPEYRVLQRRISVPDAERHVESFRLERWINMASFGWYSGDHHIHAAGCAHYESPTEGVAPDAMMRHILGEDLNVGCVLAWGPCWYHQKTFFSGAVDRLSTARHLMRYDVEVSGFPSSHAGHLCLLNLSEDDYTYPEPVEFDWSFEGENGHFHGTKTERVGEWPSWDLPVLQWAKQQGGIVGFAHSGWGLYLPNNELPNYRMAPFDGIGANEYIVDICHDACDFISTVDTPSVWELNIWYHTLNCGFTCRISGETDFPCIYGERVGLGRAYVKLPAGALTYDRWIEGIRDGRSYTSDGLSHLFDFEVNGLEVGEPGDTGRASFLAVKDRAVLTIRVQAAGLLDETPREAIRNAPLDQQPYWHIERARVGESRRVPVELVVNGRVAARQEIVADGRVQQVAFEYQPTMSSWIAVRIYPSSHTNPIFVEVDGEPIRASKKSAEWCLEAVDVCWKAKEPRIRRHERAAAAAAYEQARQVYRRILAESFDDR